MNVPINSARLTFHKESETFDIEYRHFETSEEKKKTLRIPSDFDIEELNWKSDCLIYEREEDGEKGIYYTENKSTHDSTHLNSKLEELALSAIEEIIEEEWHYYGKSKRGNPQPSPELDIELLKDIVPSTNLPINFRDIVPLFYKQGRKEDLIKYTKQLEKIVKKSLFEIKIELGWDDNLGLTSIKVDPVGNLELGKNGLPSFLGNLETENYFIPATIAMKYISELLNAE